MTGSKTCRVLLLVALGLTVGACGGRAIQSDGGGGSGGIGGFSGSSGGGSGGASCTAVCTAKAAECHESAAGCTPFCTELVPSDSQLHCLQSTPCADLMSGDPCGFSSGGIGGAGGTGATCPSVCVNLATKCGYDSAPCTNFCDEVKPSPGQLACMEATGCSALTPSDPCGLFGGGTGGAPTGCTPANECAGCTACLDACNCQAVIVGFDPSICPSSCAGAGGGGGMGGGGMGGGSSACSPSDACAACTTCEAYCACMAPDQYEACLQQICSG